MIDNKLEFLGVSEFLQLVYTKRIWWMITTALYPIIHVVFFQVFALIPKICQNSGFKTRNYVDLYCEFYGNCAHSE